jgi:HAE1 family hydrophobic/amphiphilic exporter-1
MPGANALDAADGAKKLMEKIKQSFPPDLDYVIALDTTLSVTEGIKEIEHTLIEALVLVMIVVFVFLQGWRATLIPLLAVPVSLVGTFMLFPMFGFSINTLSLFGLVLAIGLVVDDAIVVVEAVEHHIEHGMSPKDATLRAMERGHRAGDRHRRHPGRRFRADRLHSRHHRPALPAVRGDHRHLGDHLGVQRADAEPGALRHAARAQGQGQRPVAEVLRRVQRLFGRVTGGYVGVCRIAIRRSLISLVFLAAVAVSIGFLRQARPRRLPPG